MVCCMLANDVNSNENVSIAWMVHVDTHLKYYRRVLPSKIPWIDSYRKYLKNVVVSCVFLIKIEANVDKIL